MQLAIQNGGQCAFCAFRALEWLKPQAHHGLRVKVAAFHSFPKRINSDRRDSRVQLQPATKGRGRKLYSNYNQEYRRQAPRIRRFPTTPNLPIKDKDVNVFAPESFSARENVTLGMFRNLLVEQIAFVERLLIKDLQRQYSEATELRAAFEKTVAMVKALEEDALRSCDAAQKGKTNQQQNPLFFQLRRAFLHGDVTLLSAELQNAYAQKTHGMEFSIDPITKQEKLTDMRNPLDWYPATRAIQREIHLHVGPTNSGKTYHALKRLEEAKTGVYAGPLRLLAHEVYSRFNAKGKTCALVTGEEHRVPDNMQDYMTSCTVEMVPLNTKLDVAVIDEIQMLGDQDRGWAWTQALLGVQAKEVHLCGEVRATDLIRKLCTLMGDKLIIHNYERLTPLKSMKESLKGDLSNLQKGDAIILFSRVAIHSMKANIEKETGRRCAVVYGSLPPETRAQQAALFNDPNNDYDILVASDAVGMGLNLSIKRIIFEATSKFDGVQYRIIPASQIKQIAGRAGRFKSAFQAIQNDSASDSALDLGKGENRSDTQSTVGYVTTLENFDLPVLRAAMRNNVEPLRSAGIMPPARIIERFASYFPPDTPFSYINLRLHELASIHPIFFLCQLAERLPVADLIQSYDLTVKERLVFMAAPIHLRNPVFANITRELAACVAEKTTSGHILDLKTFDLELLERDINDHPRGAKGFLKEAEALHHAITLYMWLSYRFAGMFTSHALALHLKELTEQKIEECLSVFEYDPQAVSVRNARRRLQQKRQMKEISQRENAMKRGDHATLIPVPGSPYQVPELGGLERVGEESDELEEAADLETVVIVDSERSTQTPKGEMYI